MESNLILGDSYQVIRREENYEKFCEAFKSTFLRNHVVDLDETADNFTKNCFAILVTDHGSKLHPLYKNVTYYIMTGEGSTYRLIQDGNWFHEGNDMDKKQ